MSTVARSLLGRRYTHSAKYRLSRTRLDIYGHKCFIIAATAVENNTVIANTASLPVNVACAISSALNRFFASVNSRSSSAACCASACSSRSLRVLTVSFKSSSFCVVSPRQRSMSFLAAILRPVTCTYASLTGLVARVIGAVGLGGLRTKRFAVFVETNCNTLVTPKKTHGENKK